MRVILLLLILFGLAFAQMPAADKSMSWQDELTDVDPSTGVIGAKKDKKIMANMLFFYGQLRQTAEGSLEMLKSISDFALKTFNVLVRVENMVKTAQDIKEAFKKYEEVLDNWRDGKKHNPFKLFDNMIEHTYKEVIGKGTDMMWIQTAGMFDDLKALNESRQQIALSTINIGKTWDLERDTAWTVTDGDTVSFSVYVKQEGEKETLKEYQKRKMTEYEERLAQDSTTKKTMSEKMTFLSQNLQYQSKMAAQAVNMTDPRLIEKYEFNPNAKLKGARAEVISSSIANVSSRRQQHENNFQELQYAIQMASNSISGGEGSITATVKAEVLGVENTLLSSYIEHEAVNDYVKVMGAMALGNLGNMSNYVHHKSRAIVSADMWANLAKETKERIEKKENE